MKVHRIFLGDYTTCSSAPDELWSLYYTKDYAVGFKQTDCNIPKKSWNFFESQPWHSNCIMGFVGKWIEHNTFAVVWVFYMKKADTIYGQKAEPIAWPCLFQILPREFIQSLIITLISFKSLLSFFNWFGNHSTPTYNTCSTIIEKRCSFK